MAAIVSWNRIRVLVTGGSGFVGANLIRRLLAEGADVFALVRDADDAWRLQDVSGKITMLSGDISCFGDVAAALIQARPSVVFHLATARAGEDLKNFPLFLSTNTLGAYHLITAAKNSGVEIMVCAGSQLEYGQSNFPHCETDALVPDTLHGLTKASATMLFQAAAHNMQLPVVILRLFHVYGPWESPKRLIPSAIGAALTGQVLRMTQKGFCRDFVYIDDVIETFLIAAQRPDLRGEVFNIAGGCRVLNEDIVTNIERLSGKPLAVEFGAYPAHIIDTVFGVADITKAKVILGWQPHFSLENGLRATMEWVINTGFRLDRSKLISKYGSAYRKK